MNMRPYYLFQDIGYAKLAGLNPKYGLCKLNQSQSHLMLIIKPRLLFVALYVLFRWNYSFIAF